MEPVCGDRSSIREILLSSNIFYPCEIDVAVELFDDYLESGADESWYSFIFLDVEDRTVGYLCYGPIAMTDKRYDLYWIAVRKDLCGKGLGGFLLSEAEKEIRKSGGRFLYVDTSGREAYKNTRAFYRKHGYRQVACIPHFYNDNDHKIVFMKDLFQLR
ncbi:MAG: GNAT family N-acetyltransferase [Syntrophales bacterium]